MELLTFTPQTSVAELLTYRPQLATVFLRHKMSCVGCSMSTFETLEDAARIYGVELESFLSELALTVLETETTDTEPPQPAMKELLMSEPYTFFPEIAEAINTIPQESIVSRTIYRDDHLKAIVFAFAPGQELSEHTASVPAIIQIIEGEAELTLGDDHFDVKAGAWARMPPNLKHSILARTPVKMLLLMLP